jgi:uncharacterized protein YndB with AHSA1/START domain
MIRRLALMLFTLVSVALLVVLALAFARPAAYHVERRVAVAAPPDSVWAIVSDLARFRAWSPWEGLDPAMKWEVSAPSTGVGAVYHWSGDRRVGEGRMTVTASEPPSRLDVRLDFLAPMEGTSSLRFTVRPTAQGSEVVWAMDGVNDFAGRVMSVFASMDRMVGPDFERGLGRLRTLAEGATAPH